VLSYTTDLSQIEVSGDWT